MSPTETYLNAKLIMAHRTIFTLRMLLLTAGLIFIALGVTLCLFCSTLSC